MSLLYSLFCYDTLMYALFISFETKKTSHSQHHVISLWRGIFWVPYEYGFDPILSPSFQKGIDFQHAFATTKEFGARRHALDGEGGLFQRIYI